MFLVAALCASAFAQGGTGRDIGIGARAFAFAGNHTAAVNDLSAVYWNPAALAFLPVREFQASFDITRTVGESYVSGGGVSALPGAKMDNYLDRLRLRGVGAMTAIPTVQGGLTLAAAYESPFAFDDFSPCGYISNDTSFVENAVRYGDLNRWSFAFGVQVAPKIAAGLTLSIITGEDRIVFDQKLDGEKYNDLELKSSYLGYSMTGGFIYLPADYLKLGLNFNVMMNLGVSETGAVRWSEGDDKRTGNRPASLPKIKGKAYRAPYGALGAALTLPWMIAALDLRLVMPYTFIMPGEDINMPGNSQARNFKTGAGVGVEVPLPISAPIVLRAGYSIDECDFYPIVNKYEYDEIDWETGTEYLSVGSKQALSLGAAIFTSGVGFELSYGYQTWGVRHKDERRELRQTFSNHRAMGAIIFRY